MGHGLDARDALARPLVDNPGHRAIIIAGVIGYCVDTAVTRHVQGALVVKPLRNQQHRVGMKHSGGVLHRVPSGVSLIVGHAACVGHATGHQVGNHHARLIIVAPTGPTHDYRVDFPCFIQLGCRLDARVVITVWPTPPAHWACAEQQRRSAVRHIVDAVVGAAAGCSAHHKITTRRDRYGKHRSDHDAIKHFSFQISVTLGNSSLHRAGRLPTCRSLSFSVA